MPIMSQFFFYCSVRLGGIVAGIISTLQALIPLCILLGSGGADGLKENAIYIRNHLEEYYIPEYFQSLLNYLEKDSFKFITIVEITLGFYMLACFLEIFGAYKLLKLWLLPYIILELLRLIILFILHVVAMIVLKKKFSLETLIGVTVSGGFGLLLLFYIWSCVIALYQIILIVNTNSYKELYGENPLESWTQQTYKSSTAASELINQPRKFYTNTNSTNKNTNTNNLELIKNVNIYPSPNSTTYSPKKIENNNLIINKKLATILQQNEIDIMPNNLLSRDMNSFQSRFNYPIQKNQYNSYY